jgi:hypothetical protein
MPRGSLQQLQFVSSRFEVANLRGLATADMELGAADKALGAGDMVRARNCSVVAKMIVDLAYEQATLTADGGGPNIDLLVLLKPRALVYELFAGFARTVSQRMSADDLGSESGKFGLLEFLQQTSEIVGSSIATMRENEGSEPETFNALVLVQCAVNEAKSVLDGCKVRVRSAEATLACTHVRKRRMTSDEARDGEVAGGVLAALAPLTRLLVWLMKHSQLPPVDGEDVQSFLDDMLGLTASLELGASHLSRMMDMNNMLAAGLRDQTRNIDQSPLVRNLRAQVQERTDAYNAKESQYMHAWNMIGQTTLMLTDCRGVILRWNDYGQRLTSLEEQDVLGKNISELCTNSSELEWLLTNLSEQSHTLDSFEAHRIEVVLNTKTSSMDILLTLFCDNRDPSGFTFIWHGENVTDHHQSIDDLQKRLLASEQENSKLRTKQE